jgi:predicted PurR-regulated permease PerM
MLRVHLIDPSTQSFGAVAVSGPITTLEGSLLTPALMSRASSMNQVAIFAGLLFRSWIGACYSPSRG